MTRLIDPLPIGIGVLAATRRVLLSNAALAEIAGDDDGLRIVRGVLCAGEPRDHDALRAVVAGAAQARESSHASESLLRVARPSGRPALGLSIRALWPPAPTDVLVFVSDPERAARVRTGPLRALFGLTAAQASLAARIVRGERLSDIARHAQLSINTIRTHMKEVFAKTGAERQADLVRLLAWGPGGLRPDEDA